MENAQNQQKKVNEKLKNILILSLKGVLCTEAALCSALESCTIFVGK